ncbi:MAG TPA: porin family protein [Chitinivibrionales bacterium]|nr:porin family protein [Chitinivibrionales bacterium]
MKFWRLFLLCAALCESFPASAPAVDFYAGVKGGLGLSGFWGAQAADSAGMSATVLAGFCGGAAAWAQFNDFFAGQLEFLYAMKGNSSRGASGATTVEKQWNMDCLEIPLLAKFTYPGKNARPLLYIGPSFGFPFTSKYRVKTTTEAPAAPNGYVSTDTTFDLKSNTSALDVGIAVGFGMDFVIEYGIIIFDLRATPGFISWDTRLDHDIKNYSIVFMIGYAYKF